jgi:hypothetical protein
MWLNPLGSQIEDGEVGSPEELELLSVPAQRRVPRYPLKHSEGSSSILPSVAGMLDMRDCLMPQTTVDTCQMNGQCEEASQKYCRL